MNEKVKDFKSKPNCEIHEHHTKHNEKVYVSFSNTNKILISICSPNYNLTKPWDAEIYCFKRKDHIFIHDLISQTKRKGYGSLLIKLLIIKARELGYNKIEAGISHSDLRITPSLYTFYESLKFISKKNLIHKEGFVGYVTYNLNNKVFTHN